MFKTTELVQKRVARKLAESALAQGAKKGNYAGSEIHSLHK
jgi:hypothetical protein